MRERYIFLILIFVLSIIVLTAAIPAAYLHGAAASEPDEPLVLLISSTIKDGDILARSALSGVRVVHYHAPDTDVQDLLTKIRKTLAGSKATAIGIASHDLGPGRFYLTGHETVTLGSTLSKPTQKKFWQQLGTLVRPGGRIDLLSCRLAAGQDGPLLVAAIQEASGRTTTASTDNTGNPGTGGNWILENGNIDLVGSYFDFHHLATYDKLLLTELTQVTADDGAYQDYFGYSVAIWKDTAIVGSYRDDGKKGAAYIFSRDQGGNDNWGQIKKLVSPLRQSNEMFGYSVDIGDNVALIGVPYAEGDKGAVYVASFDSGGGGWSIVDACITEDEKKGDAPIVISPLYSDVTSSCACNGKAGDLFGYSVSLWGNTAAIGAPGYEAGAYKGAVFFFGEGDAVSGYPEKLWKRDAKQQGETNSWLGASVAISGDTVFAGAPYQTSDPNKKREGRVYIFSRNRGGIGAWGMVANTTSQYGAIGDFFGYSVSMWGDTAIVGAPGSNRAELFYRTGEYTWDVRKHFPINSSNGTGEYGYSVTLCEDMALIGARYQYANQGAAYIYVRNWGGPDNWGFVKNITPSNGKPDDLFGSSIDLYGDTAIVGSITADGIDNDCGGAYLFGKPDIEIKQGNTVIANGGTYDFGTLSLYHSKEVYFTIANPGKRPLGVTTPLVLNNAGSYSITNQPASSIDARGTTTFSVLFTANTEGVHTSSVSISNTDYVKDPYVVYFTASTPVPLIRVDGDTDFGEAPVLNGKVNKTFTIGNIGNDTLNLTGSPVVTVLGTDAQDFSVTTQPGSTALPPGRNTTFQVTFDPSVVALRTAGLRIPNNDHTHNPYTLNIQGIGTASPPVVITGVAAAQGMTAITCGGEVIFTGGSGVTVTKRGVCYGTAVNPTLSGHFTQNGTGTGAFSSLLTGLQSGTTYYIRAYAVNSRNMTAYGGSVKVTLPTTAPTVTTQSPTGVTASGATFTGDAVPAAATTLTSLGFCWGTSPSPNISGNSKQVNGTASPFSLTINTLGPGKKYYVRAYAIDSNGNLGYGADQAFTTVTGDPVISGGTAVVTGPTSVTCGGTVDSDGGSTVTERGACYSTNPEPTIGDADTQKKSDGKTGTGPFSVTVDNLPAGTTQHVRAYATNSNGKTGYGTEISVKPSTDLPTVETVSIGDATNTSAVCNGNVSAQGGSSVSQRGVCWGTDPNPTKDGNNVSGGSGTGAFSGTLTGLSQGRVYYARAYAVNSSGTVYGDDLKFITPAIPSVTTDSVKKEDTLAYTVFCTVPADGGATVTQRGVCWGTAKNPSTSGSHQADVKDGTGAFSIPITSLNTSTQYYARSYAVNRYGTAYGSDLAFNTMVSAPEVGDLVLLDVSDSSITAAGTVIENPANPITAKGICASTTSPPTVSGNQPNEGAGGGSFNSTATGLATDTRHYVRPYATTSKGTAYGPEASVATGGTDPAVIIQNPTDIGNTQAKCTANVTLKGTKDVTERGFCWGRDASPTTSDSTVKAGSGTGAFTKTLTGLRPGTTYHVRPYARNASKTVYGNEITFTTTGGDTSAALPKVETAAVSGVTATTVTGGGKVVDGGGVSITARGVCWGTATNPTLSGDHSSDGTGTGEFTSAITGLTAGTTYNVRAYATNSAGTAYGDKMTFTTGEPAISGSIDENSSPIADVQVEVKNNTSGAKKSTTSDFKGDYTVTVPSNASITVTPKKTGYTFTPPNRTHTNVTASLSNQDFSGSSQANGEPELSVTPSRLNFAVQLSGIQTGPQRFLVANTGGGTLNWTAVSSDDWLNISPVSAMGDGYLTVSVNSGNFNVGEASGIVTVMDPDASNSPVRVRVYVKVTGNGNDEPPEGSFDSPADGSIIRGSVAVTGWVIDDVEVDRVQIFRSPPDGQAGERVYVGDAVFVEGARPDVELKYPTHPKNTCAGWGYMLLSNFLPNKGNGTFVLYAVAVDTGGNTVTLGSKTIICDNANAVKPFGAIDTPAQGGTASGNYRNMGWVLTPQPNIIPKDGSTVRVYVDGAPIGNPVYDMYRPDVAELFPGYRNSNGAGGAFYLDTAQYTTGLHNIAWVVTDNAGHTDGIGSRFFTVINTRSAETASTSSDDRTGGLVINETNKTTETNENRMVQVFPVTRAFQELQMLPPEESSFLPIGRGEVTVDERIFPMGSGFYSIKIHQLEPLSIGSGECTVISGYSVVDGTLRPLPVGSGISIGEGNFTWLPGPGFLGTYRLLFVCRENSGRLARRHITITVHPQL